MRDGAVVLLLCVSWKHGRLTFLLADRDTSGGGTGTGAGGGALVEGWSREEMEP